MDKELLDIYKNGNYIVRIYSDGTKIKSSKDDKFIADFPDSIDLKITNYCDLNCPMCHEKSSTDGFEGDLNSSFLNSLHRGTELAIGGGNPLSHKKLLPFLVKMKRKKVICNLTLNEKHFLKHKSGIDFKSFGSFTFESSSHPPKIMSPFNFTPSFKITEFKE